MSSKLLDSSKIKELQPAYALWKLYQPDKAPLRFTARTKKEAEKWQIAARNTLEKTLGLGILPKAPLSPKRIETVDKGDYVREKILLRTSAYTLMPVYLLLPKKADRPLPVVLAFHGHGYGVKDIVGLWEDGSERQNPDGYQKHFGVMLCKKGFAVAAPEISCFGERQTDFHVKPGQSAPSTCTHTAQLALHLGTSALGLRIHDGLKLVDYLETRRDLDVSRLGAMGISGGGMHTLFSTCVDTRIRACVVSGYFCTFRDSIFAMTHCACNYVPNLHVFGEMFNLAGLIAPRPMLVESGNHDSIFPQKAVRGAVKNAERIYQIFGADGNIEADYFEGRHQISGRRAYDFLYEKLIG
ncbi:MAG TPA: alpha/beta hydrolase family protein [Candidatus Hydrogenedentes bacterium]|nr:alpha/beta hydrolase family protein [Candidatus Hydrogenedentota bacterium]HOL78251.1 alpha/beta hydrolase family protein [Candidatus Hydrogenedentota bacterium]HPO86391.1 alpha/beta hydrolase family protein [Candidatus Hydrogenedentota bacterium]